MALAYLLKVSNSERKKGKDKAGQREWKIWRGK